MQPAEQRPTTASVIYSLVVAIVVFGGGVALWIYSEVYESSARTVMRDVAGEVVDVSVETTHQAVSGKHIKWTECTLQVNTGKATEELKSARDYMIPYLRQLQPGDEVAIQVSKNGDIAGVSRFGQVLVSPEDSILTHGISHSLLSNTCVRVTGIFCAMMLIMAVWGAILTIRAGKNGIDGGDVRLDSDSPS